MRRKYQLTRNRVQLQNRLEALLEEAHIKLSSLVSDLLGASARRMLKALADGETSPAALASLADKNLRATPAQLCDALGACTEFNPVYRRLLYDAFMEELQLIDQQTEQLDKEMATLLSQDQAAVERLAEVPGLGVDSAQQDHRRSGCQGRDIRFGQESLFLGGSVPRRGGERGSIQEATAPRRATVICGAFSISAHNAAAKSEGNHFPDRVLYPTGVAPGTQSDHWCDCPSTLSSDLDHFAPGCALRRARPRSECKVKTQAHYADDSGTSQPRLSGGSSGFSSMRPGFSTLRTELNQLLVIPLLAHHPVQANC